MKFKLALALVVVVAAVLLAGDAQAGGEGYRDGQRISANAVIEYVSADYPHFVYGRLLNSSLRFGAYTMRQFRAWQAVRISGRYNADLNVVEQVRIR